MRALRLHSRLLLLLALFAVLTVTVARAYCPSAHAGAASYGRVTAFDTVLCIAGSAVPGDPLAPAGAPPACDMGCGTAQAILAAPMLMVAAAEFAEARTTPRAQLDDPIPQPFTQDVRSSRGPPLVL